MHNNVAHFEAERCGKAIKPMTLKRKTGAKLFGMIEVLVKRPCAPKTIKSQVKH